MVRLKVDERLEILRPLFDMAKKLYEAADAAVAAGVYDYDKVRTAALDIAETIDEDIKIYEYEAERSGRVNND